MNDRIFQSMMQSMGGFGAPFDMFAGPPDGGQRHRHQGQHQQQHTQFDPMSALLSPQSFMSPMSMMMMNPFAGMHQAMSMMPNGSSPSFSYSSSSVTSYTTDEYGRPQVYQQSQEVKSGPDGVRETKSAVRDSRSGKQELSIGHHIYDKAHVQKKSKNVYTGEEEQCEEFVNLEDNEADEFEQTWTQKARGSQRQLHQRSANRLALTSSAREDSPHIRHPHRSLPASSSSRVCSERPAHKSQMDTEKKKKKRKKSPVGVPNNCST